MPPSPPQLTRPPSPPKSAASARAQGTGKLLYGDVLPYQVGHYYRDLIPPCRHNPEAPIWLDHVPRKAVARDKRQRFETEEEFFQ